MQEVIVAVIVLCAALAVLKRYLPRTVRAALRRKAGRIAGKIGWGALAGALEKKGSEESAASCDDGCGTCGGCQAGDPIADKRTIMIREL